MTMAYVFLGEEGRGIRLGGREERGENWGRRIRNIMSA